MSRLLLVLAAGVVASTLGARVAEGQTFKVAKYNIGGEGGTDYVTAEAGTTIAYPDESCRLILLFKNRSTARSRR